MDDKKRRDNPQKDIELPQTIIETFARFLLPEIHKYYTCGQGQREFDKWRKQTLSKTTK